jgi:hypothetical protein
VHLIPPLVDLLGWLCPNTSRKLSRIAAEIDLQCACPTCAPPPPLSYAHVICTSTHYHLSLYHVSLKSPKSLLTANNRDILHKNLIQTTITSKMGGQQSPCSMQISTSEIPLQFAHVRFVTYLCTKFRQ